MATRTATHGASAKDPELLAVIQGWCKDVGIKKNSARARAPVIVAAEDPDVVALIEERGTVPAGKKAGINKNSASAPVLDGSFFALTRQVSTLETENAALKRALAHAREDAAAYAEVAGELEEDCKAKGEEAERCAKSAADALARLAVAEAAVAELKAQRALAVSSPNHAATTSIWPIPSMSTLPPALERQRPALAPIRRASAENAGFYPAREHSSVATSIEIPRHRSQKTKPRSQLHNSCGNSTRHRYQTRESATIQRPISIHTFELAMWQRAAEKKRTAKKTHAQEQVNQDMHATASASTASKDLVCKSNQGADKQTPAAPDDEVFTCFETCITHSLSAVLRVILLACALVLLFAYYLCCTIQ